jgi:single-strand DNA-binding protein
VHEPFITVVGNVGAPPRTRVVGSGAVVTDFRIASTPRRVDRATGAWSDGETIWFGVSCWRLLAEHVAASLRTGDRVVVTGHLRAHTWRTEQGEERSGLEVDAQTVGFDLSRGKAVQERTVPLTVTSDPGVRADPHTGVVLDEPDPDPGEAAGPRRAGGRARRLTGCSQARRPVRRPPAAGSGSRRLCSHGAVHLLDAEGPQGRRRQGHPG